MTRWNIFACELEDILADHGLRLSQLDDRAFIHREKVRRLRKSLERPKSFPVLNPDEMDEVISAIALDGYEVLRLRAAIVAASIQEMLVERIDAENALIAVEQMFPTIMMAMEQHQDEGRGIAAMRGGKDTTISEKETAIEQALEGPLTIFDRATRAFHVSRNSETEVERFEQRQKAKNGFDTVLWGGILMAVSQTFCVFPPQISYTWSQKLFGLPIDGYLDWGKLFLHGLSRCFVCCRPMN